MNNQTLYAAKDLLDRIIWLESRAKLGHTDEDASKTPEMMKRLLQILERASK